MARSVLASAIMDRIRFLIDDETGEALASDPQVLVELDVAWTRLHRLLVDAEPDRYRTEATITSTGVASYALPADWMRTIGIDYRQDSATYLPLSRLHEQQRHLFNGQTSGQHSLAYRVIGTNVVLYPTPVNGQVYRHIYLPVATAVSSSATSLDCRHGDDDILAKIVARTCMQREETYAGQWDDEIKKLETDLTEQAHLRYLHEADLMFAPDDLDPEIAADMGRWG